MRSCSSLKNRIKVYLSTYYTFPFVGNWLFLHKTTDDMIDDTIVNEALCAAWEDFDESQWKDLFMFEKTLRESFERDTVESLLKSIDTVMETTRQRFYMKLAERIPKESRKTISLDELARILHESDSSLIISDAKDGIKVTTPEDTFGITVKKGYKVSVHSIKNHIGWDATTWGQDDIVKAIIVMSHYDSLAIPIKEKYKKKWEEKERRSSIVFNFREEIDGLRHSVYSELEGNRDVEAYRDSFVSYRKAFYESLGDPFDDVILEKDWREFVDDIASSLESDRKQAAMAEARKLREEAREMAKEICSNEISCVLGRNCWIERRSPYGMRHWDEYLVELADGRVVWFKDYTRQLGSINKAIITLVPILEELALFASTKFTLGRCSSPQIEYSKSNRSYFGRMFLEMAGDNEIMIYLSEKFGALKAPVILWPAKRTVKLFCYYPGNTLSSLSFTLRRISSKEEVDQLVDAISSFHAAMKKYPCNLG